MREDWEDLRRQQKVKIMHSCSIPDSAAFPIASWVAIDRRCSKYSPAQRGSQLHFSSMLAAAPDLMLCIRLVVFISPLAGGERATGPVTICYGGRIHAWEL